MAPFAYSPVGANKATEPLRRSSSSDSWHLKQETIGSEHERLRRRSLFALCSAAVVVAWAISLALTAWLASNRCAAGPSYEAGFDTDLEPLRPMIELHQVKFTGGLKFDENGTVYRHTVPGAVQYVGEPSDELDRVWNELLEGEGVDLMGNEAHGVAGKTYQKPGGWWLTGADVFHQLHCVNAVRRGLRRDYYTEHDPEPVYTMHLDHCLDYLRQAIMCGADLTMVPILWSDVRNRIIPEFETVHTCRNWEKIHAWSLARTGNRHPIS